MTPSGTRYFTPTVVTILVLFAASLSAVAGQCRAIRIRSPATGGSRTALVITPSDYSVSGDSSRYPVIYFLHGYGASPRQWLRVAPLEELADRYRVIMVCADGGRVWWWIDSPIRKKRKFATHVTEELISAVDSLYRTIRAARGRALIGSSMGGHGALTLYVARPDLFCTAASVSGIPDLRQCAGQWGIERVLGTLKGNEERWRSYSFLGMLSHAGHPPGTIILVWGRDDWAAESNRRARDQAAAAGFSVEWTEADGGHTSEFVRTHLPQVIGRVAELVHATSEVSETP